MSDNRDGVNDGNYSVESLHMEERLNQMSSACKEIQNKSELQESKYRPMIFHVKEYNLSYCGVGKAGGTFVKQFLSILSDGEDKSRRLESLSRLKVHYNSGKFRGSIKTRSDKSTKVFTVVRDHIPVCSLPTQTACFFRQ